MQSQVEQRIPRGFEFALAGTSLLWAIAAFTIAQRSAHGLAGRFHLLDLEPLLAALFSVFLLTFGFQLLDWIATRRGEIRDAFPLPRRAGWLTEWGIGAAIGWGLGLAAVLPLLLSANLRGQWAMVQRHPARFPLALLTLLAATLAQELVFRGYPFQRLAAAIGPSWAAVLTSLGFAVALVWSNPPDSLLLGLIDGALFGLLLAMSYLRTHALWVGWGLHAAYRAMILLFVGLPAVGHSSAAALMDTFATGPSWLTGGGFGLDAAMLTMPLLLGAVAVLYRCTRDYAWNYTHRPIVGAGYEVAVAPPKAHVAMQQAPTPPPLVQIHSSTSQSPTVQSTPAPNSSREN